ncbi:MAG: hypothetical protein ACRELA_01875 [Candidatus Rokuibacteriota bacterium]
MTEAAAAAFGGTTPLAAELRAAIIGDPEENEICLKQRGVVWAGVAVPMVRAVGQLTGRRARFGGVPGSTESLNVLESV